MDETHICRGKSFISLLLPVYSRLAGPSPSHSSVHRTPLFTQTLLINLPGLRSGPFSQSLLVVITDQGDQNDLPLI